MLLWLWLYEVYQGFNLCIRQMTEIRDPAVAVFPVGVNQLPLDLLSGALRADFFKACGHIPTVTSQGMTGFATLGVDQLACRPIILTCAGGR